MASGEMVTCLPSRFELSPSRLETSASRFKALPPSRLSSSRSPARSFGGGEAVGISWDLLGSPGQAVVISWARSRSLVGCSSASDPVAISRERPRIDGGLDRVEPKPMRSVRSVLSPSSSPSRGLSLSATVGTSAAETESSSPSELSVSVLSVPSPLSSAAKAASAALLSGVPLFRARWRPWGPQQCCVLDGCLALYEGDALYARSSTRASRATCSVRIWRWIAGLPKRRSAVAAAT